MPIYGVIRGQWPERQWQSSYEPPLDRTIKESMIKAYGYEGLVQLWEYVKAFVQSDNFDKHLKALRWKTPFLAMCEA